MNGNQKTVVFVSTVISFLSLVYVPFKHFHPKGGAKYDFVLTALEESVWHVSIMHILIQLAIIWAVAALLIGVLKNSQ